MSAATTGIYTSRPPLSPHDGLPCSGGTGGIRPTRLGGFTLNPGLAQGLAVLHQPQLTIRQMVADDPKEELARFNHAVDTMHATLDQLLETTEASGVEESRDILETYRMFARDRGWLGRIHEDRKSTRLNSSH